ncbi:MAG: methyltransferase [Clostridium sp.]|nr:methyltransferase [Clostridium sp.]
MMKKDSFQFKQFTIYQDRCAMKVGTDGVLLGCWCPLPESGTILDIGTGTGLIALIIAQRHLSVQITGIDIDEQAIGQAQANAGLSPWSDRLNFIHTDVLAFTPGGTFNAIVCNPPFFPNSLQGPDPRRNRARHTDSLPFKSLVSKVSLLLSADGLFSVIIPSGYSDEFVQICWENNLNLYRKCMVFTKLGKPSKRVLLAFRKGSTAYPLEEMLNIMEQNGEYSQAYIALTQDFYWDK